MIKSTRRQQKNNVEDQIFIYEGCWRKIIELILKLKTKAINKISFRSTWNM